MEHPRETLGKHERLRKQAEFQRMFDTRRSMSDKLMALYTLPNGLAHSRFGVAAGKKLGNAVVRNRLKRLGRDLFRRNKDLWPVPVDVLLLPRKAAVDADHADLLASYLKLARRAARDLQPAAQTAPVADASKPSVTRKPAAS